LPRRVNIYKVIAVVAWVTSGLVAVGVAGVAYHATKLAADFVRGL